MKLRIASYNLFEGAAATYNRLTEFIHSLDIDLLCLQEVNSWQDNDFARLRDFADKASFTNYQYGNSNTEFKLATYARVPFIKNEVYVEGFWHCAVRTDLQLSDRTVSVVNVHLDPWEETARLREIEHLLSRLDLTQSIIITGDFNSLSRRDEYPPDLLERLQQRGITKFGRQELAFDVTDRLEQAGMVDVGAKMAQTIATVPTPAAADPSHEVPVRIDYIFASADLADGLVDVRVVKDNFSDVISDHYPVMAVFDLEGRAPAPIPTVEQSMPTDGVITWSHDN